MQIEALLQRIGRAYVERHGDNVLPLANTLANCGPILKPHLADEKNRKSALRCCECPIFTGRKSIMNRKIGFSALFRCLPRMGENGHIPRHSLYIKMNHESFSVSPVWPTVNVRIPVKFGSNHRSRSYQRTINLRVHGARSAKVVDGRQITYHIDHSEKTN